MTSQPRILLHGSLMPALEKRLAGAFEMHRLRDQADPATYLRDQGASFTGLATSARVGADAALIAALPSLRVISSFGVGYETIDVDAARARGIAIGYTPDVLNDCVADLAFGLLIDCARQISFYDRFTRRGDWPRGGINLTTKVAGKNLGIVGLGRIGRVLARRAAGFDMAVRYHSRNAVPDSGLRHEPSLLELARWSDFLVVLVAGGPATRGMINAPVLQALGAQGYLINVARGSVVDEPALVAALQARQIAGAGLDVYADEPNVPAAMLTMDNLVLSPHVASGTHETRQAMSDRMFDNLQAFYRDGTLLSAV